MAVKLYRTGREAVAALIDHATAPDAATAAKLAAIKTREPKGKKK